MADILSGGAEGLSLPGGIVPQKGIGQEGVYGGGAAGVGGFYP